MGKNIQRHFLDIKNSTRVISELRYFQIKIELQQGDIKEETDAFLVWGARILAERAAQVSVRFRIFCNGEQPLRCLCIFWHDGPFSLFIF